jgi:predicted lipoprotein with Yx(FWY)xxD motif
VQLAETTLGEVMVNTDGRTLYLFTKDSGTTTACTGGCAQTWPALQAAGEPTAGKGVDASKLATASGQVAYGGRLLYLYSGDKAKGDVNGQGIGGVWFVVGPDGEPVKATPTTSGTSY